MPVSSHFNHYNYTPTQDLYESLVIEHIQQRGRDVYYCPKVDGNLDYLFGEDSIPSFDTSYIMEIIQDPNGGWNGNRETITKFGFEIQDETNIYVSKKRFTDIVTLGDPLITKPREGDLIADLFFKNTLWEIIFVDDELSDIDFYAYGKNFLWEIRLQRFIYKQETLQTGVTEIDNVGTSLEQNSVNGIDNIEPQADNKKIETEGQNIIDFSEDNPFGTF